MLVIFLRNLNYEESNTRIKDKLRQYSMLSRNNIKC